MPPITLYTDKARLSRIAALRGVAPAEMDDQIVRQSGVMDGYFRARLTLPFVQVGVDVQDKCTALVAFNLLTDRGWNPNDGGGDDAITMRYRDAVQWLKDVRDGKIMPDVTGSGGAVEAQPQTSAALCSSPSRGWSTAGQVMERGGQGAFVGGRGR